MQLLHDVFFQIFQLIAAHFTDSTDLITDDIQQWVTQRFIFREFIPDTIHHVTDIWHAETE